MSKNTYRLCAHKVPYYIHTHEEKPLNDSIPNTAAELVAKNTTATPQECWERVRQLKTTDLQVFTWNCLDLLKDIHQEAIKTLSEDGDPDGLLPLWIRDHERILMASVAVNSLVSE